MSQRNLKQRNDALGKHVAAIRRLRRRATRDIVEIGKRLARCKKIVGHGNWSTWLDQQFSWRESNARRFMRLHELVRTKTANLADLENLLPSVACLLAAPSTSEAARTHIIARAKSGPVTVQYAKQTISEMRPPLRLVTYLPQSKRASPQKILGAAELFDSEGRYLVRHIIDFAVRLEHLFESKESNVDHVVAAVAPDQRRKFAEALRTIQFFLGLVKVALDKSEPDRRHGLKIVGDDDAAG